MSYSVVLVADPKNRTSLPRIVRHVEATGEKTDRLTNSLPYSTACRVKKYYEERFPECIYFISNTRLFGNYETITTVKFVTKEGVYP